MSKKKFITKRGTCTKFKVSILFRFDLDTEMTTETRMIYEVPPHQNKCGRISLTILTGFVLNLIMQEHT